MDDYISTKINCYNKIKCNKHTKFAQVILFWSNNEILIYIIKNKQNNEKNANEIKPLPTEKVFSSTSI